MSNEEPVKATPEVIDATPAPAPTSKPPTGVADGGTWGTLKYVGSTTQMLACCGFLCFYLPGLCILACPQDEMDAYTVNGKVSTE